MKSRKEFNEKEIKALLTRLKEGQEQYPADLLENRRARFLVSVPPAGFILASKAIYKTILHGIQTTVVGVTKVILLSVIGMTAVGTVLVGYNQGWARFLDDEVRTIPTIVAPANQVGTLPASDLEETIAAYHPSETISPSQTPTITPTDTPTPTSTPTGTITPIFTPVSTFTSSPAPDDNPIQLPRINPTATPNIKPTDTPKIEPTDTPKVEPTDTPKIEPTDTPRIEPTDTPKVEPTDTPRIEPTDTPIIEPTHTPVIHPTHTPEFHPTRTREFHPTRTPDINPTRTREIRPTDTPADNHDGHDCDKTPHPGIRTRIPPAP